MSCDLFLNVYRGSLSKDTRPRPGILYAPLFCHFRGPKIDRLTVLTVSESFRFVLITKSVKITTNTAACLRSERGFRKKVHNQGRSPQARRGLSPEI
jgi:hypothetical protein